MDASMATEWDEPQAKALIATRIAATPTEKVVTRRVMAEDSATERLWVWALPLMAATLAMTRPAAPARTALELRSEAV